MKLHPRVARLHTESAFKVLARARELERAGRAVIHLEIGQPDFPTPPHVREAAARALEEGKTGYGPTPGIPELRAAIALSVSRTRGIPVTPDQVVVCPGAKPIIFYTVGCLIGEGDEAIVPDPGFPMYASAVAHFGGLPVPLPLRERSEFRFEPDEFLARLTPRTRLVILNSPNNPTGGALTAGDLEVIAAEARRRDFVVLSDEIYHHFAYDGPAPSIAALPGMAERTVILDGLSKSYSMTGWRVGYGVVPPPLREPFELYNVNIVSCAPTFNQWGALAAITGPQDCVARMVGEFRRRRDLLVQGLNELPGVSCRLPAGAFYAFPNITATGETSDALARRLLEEAGVAVLSGRAFGAAGEGHLRLSYASSLESLGEALERMRRALGASS